MSRLKLTADPVPFAALEAQGAFAPVAAAADRSAREAGFALLEPELPPVASAAPELDRDALAAVVARENPELPPPPPEADYVVAGQQAGLLTGPLYTVLKAAHAIALAAQLSSRHERPILPLFWVASEDHDIDEVRHVTLFGERYAQPYAGPRERGRRPPVADVPLAAAREPLLAFLRRTLRETEFTAALLDQIAAADFSTYETAFIDWMRAIFAPWPLHFVTPRALRTLTAVPLARLVERWPQVEQALAAGAARVAALGWPVPLTDARIFELAGGARRPLTVSAAGATLSDGTHSLAELAAAVRAQPERFSPSAALRPVCQDAVIPGAAMLAGPSELTYLWQITPLYAVADVRPAPRFPRNSLTLLDPPIARELAKLGRRPAELFALPAEPAAEERDPPALRRIARASRELLAAIDAAAGEPAPRWWRTSRTAIADNLERITTGLREAQLAARGQDRRRVEKILAAALPGGKLQERSSNIFQFLDLHGPDFMRALVEQIDPTDARHRIVTIAVEEDA